MNGRACISTTPFVPAFFSQKSLATVLKPSNQSRSKRYRELARTMAVQARRLQNAFSPDFHCRVESGGVPEGMQMLASHNHQIGYGARDEDKVLTVLSDHPQSDLTCNVSGSSRKRRRNAAAPIYQHLPTREGALAAPRAFQVSSGLSFPVIESAAPSTSGVSSASILPFGSGLSPELLALFYQQSNEMDALIRHQNERLRLAMVEARKKHCRELLSSLSRHALNRIREKEIELENASRRNADLEEKARQISAQSLIWFNLARNNEAVVSSLKATLEQAMIQNLTAASPQPREGFGETDCSPFPADDAQSCCFETPASGRRRRRMICKLCSDDDVCVLVLPCRHLCLCRSCDSRTDTCPVCHSHKNATLQIFMS